MCTRQGQSVVRLNHVFNIVQGLAPVYLGEHFERNTNITRGGGLKYEFSVVPRVGSHNKSNFYYNAILDWNSLPISVKSLQNRESFKIAVKEHLVQTAREREDSDFI